MAILRATFTAFVDQGPTSDSIPLLLEWSSDVSEFTSVRITVPIAPADYTINPPATGTLLVLIPPLGNTSTYTLKGAAGDTGVVLNLLSSRPLVLPLFGVGSILLRSNAAPIVGMTMIIM